ncbi:MAG: PglZ domain-containing protein [Subdoligranulum sp.]
MKIAAMIRRIAGSANTLHFIVTADHGFLYKRHALAESDKIPNTAPENGVCEPPLYCGR